MLKFKTIETLKTNTEILKAIKDYTYKVNKISNKPFYIKEYNHKYNYRPYKDISIRISELYHSGMLY